MAEKRITVGGEYDRELSVFMSVMRLKMEANRHKGRWQDMDLAKVLARIKDETDELAEAIERGSPIDILLESADIGNFAMIAAVIGMERAGKPLAPNPEGAVYDGTELYKRYEGVPPVHEFEPHGVWHPFEGVWVRMYRHVPTGAMTFADHPEARSRGLPIYPHTKGE